MHKMSFSFKHIPISVFVYFLLSQKYKIYDCIFLAEKLLHTKNGTQFVTETGQDRNKI